MTINNRIELIINELGLNKNSFSVAIGVNPTVIHNIIKGRNAPGFDVLYRTALSFGNIDMNWVITGKGSMLVVDDLSSISESTKEKSKFNETEVLSNERRAMYEELIKSLRQQIELQSKLIGHLEKNKSTDELGLK